MAVRSLRTSTCWSLSARIIAGALACVSFSGPLHLAAGSPVAPQPVSVLNATKHDRRDVALLILPSYAVTSKIVAEGVNRRTKSVEVPLDPRLVGWFRRGSQPGEVGTALFFGHRARNGAFWHVPDMKRGTPIRVIGLNGVVTNWKVTALQTIAKDHLPQTLFQIDGPPKLALVTCGGDFDYRIHHYRDNVIAWAEPTKK